MLPMREFQGVVEAPADAVAPLNFVECLVDIGDQLNCRVFRIPTRPEIPF